MFESLANFASNVRYQSNTAPVDIYALKIDNSESDWDLELRRELDQLCSLEVGWDGYDSLAVAFQNAEKAFRFLTNFRKVLSQSSLLVQRLVPSAPFLVPVSGGALQAEWHIDGFRVEIFFDVPDSPVVAAYSEDAEFSDYSDEFEIPEFENHTELKGLVQTFRTIRRLVDADA